ncbi:XRE family transcriptional regulator [Chryseobacterium arthrosphaerae]|uniref:XRE family transcriptional regulator n=1 Tax=Chryseobacterium arthrosphaerae TaxID=651561 RepID=A0A432DYU6_9FLAO|nr:XRE family transcriptional regulator [Chryseobacterium arthrosphaerae]
MNYLEFKESGRTNMKQADIAKSIGVGTRAVQYWEKGERKIPETTAYFVTNLLQEQQKKLNDDSASLLFF